MAQEKRYYYKHKDGHGFLNLKSPTTNKDYVEITKAEFEELTKVPEYTPTEEELRIENIKKQIATKKSQLAATDYKCLKFIDGALTEEEYAPIKATRQTLRDEINELESQL